MSNIFVTQVRLPELYANTTSYLSPKLITSKELPIIKYGCIVRKKGRKGQMTFFYLKY